MAATLAATTVAYRTTNAAGQPLIPHSVLNAVLLLVVLTSIGGPLLTQRFVRKIAPLQPARRKDKTVDGIVASDA